MITLQAFTALMSLICVSAAFGYTLRGMIEKLTMPEPEDDREHLIEEIADVSVCMTALSDIAPLSDVCEIIVQKANRWTDRINTGGETNADTYRMDSK